MRKPGRNNCCENRHEYLDKRHFAWIVLMEEISLPLGDTRKRLFDDYCFQSYQVAFQCCRIKWVVILYLFSINGHPEEYLHEAFPMIHPSRSCTYFWGLNRNSHLRWPVQINFRREGFHRPIHPPRDSRKCPPRELFTCVGFRQKNRNFGICSEENFIAYVLYLGILDL